MLMIPFDMTAMDKVELPDGVREYDTATWSDSEKGDFEYYFEEIAGGLVENLRSPWARPWDWQRFIVLPDGLSVEDLGRAWFYACAPEMMREMHMVMTERGRKA